MSTSRKKKALRRLKSALDRTTPVTITREDLDWDETSGFVIALTNDWVVLHSLDGAYLDGVTLLRLDLVTKVRAHQDEAYVMRATDGLRVPLISFDASLTRRSPSCLKSPRRAVRSSASILRAGTATG